MTPDIGMPLILVIFSSRNENPKMPIAFGLAAIFCTIRLSFFALLDIGAIGAHLGAQILVLVLVAVLQCLHGRICFTALGQDQFGDLPISGARSRRWAVNDNGNGRKRRVDVAPVFSSLRLFQTDWRRAPLDVFRRQFHFGACSGFGKAIPSRPTWTSMISSAPFLTQSSRILISSCDARPFRYRGVGHPHRPQNSFMPAPVPVDSITGDFMSGLAFAVASDTAVAKGYTVDEPTTRRRSRFSPLPRHCRRMLKLLVQWPMPVREDPIYA